MTVWETVFVAFVTAALTATGSWAIAVKRLKEEYRLQFRAEALIRRLLSHKAWELRTFDAIRKHIGGFQDNDLRQLLVRSGAVRFYRGDVELWGLESRVGEALESHDYTAWLVDRN